MVACTWAASETSQAANAARAPAPVSSSVTWRPVSSLTSATTTAAPSLVNSRAAAAPWPLPAPVMTATLPSSFPMNASFRTHAGRLRPPMASTALPDSCRTWPARRCRTALACEVLPRSGRYPADLALRGPAGAALRPSGSLLCALPG